MTDKEAKIIIKKYLKDVSTKVVCSYTIKKFFISDLKNKLNDYFEDNQHITMDLIHSNFGTPEEIANGFDELKTDKLQNQAKNFKIFLIITISILIILALIIFLILKDYGSNVVVTKKRGF